MGRAGRGSSGGRSGGFSGGGRRSGGFSGGGRSRGGVSRSRSGGSFWGGPVRHTVFVPTGGYRGGGHNGGGATLVTVLVILIVAFFVFQLFTVAAGGGNIGSVAASTVAREPLPAGAVDETGYYTDELGWIVDSGRLTSGMKDFYRQTGIQPYLYITDTIDGSHNITTENIAQYAEKLYGQLFTDEAHFLVVFCEYNGVYHVGYTIGAQAKSVLDDEALGIFRDYLDRYYYDDISEEEFFSKSFSDTAERIMSVTKSPWPMVFVVFGLLLLTALLYYWWKKRKEQQKLEHERTEELLKTPLDSFGDTQAEALAEKYQQPSSTGAAPDQEAENNQNK